MALTGHLSDLSLSELIEFFCNQRKTGQLKVLYPQGPGYFYLHTGSVVDARIGVLRGIDAVYYALTLPNAKFEFGGSSEHVERTINQPWTQVVLEGLRRLDEGVVPEPAFPPDYSNESSAPEVNANETSFTELESLRVPAFLSFIGAESLGKRKWLVAGAVAGAVVTSVVAIGFPAGWYGRIKTATVSGQPASQSAPAQATSSSTVTEVPASEPSGYSEGTDHSNDAALAAKRQREKEKNKAREERAATVNQSSATSASSAPKTVVNETVKQGPKRISVTVTYDESGRVTQASGGDASALRIARQKRFPPGKAGSATITIPIN